jgi:hypothetical protein
MKISYLYIVLMAGVGILFSSCSDFLDREPITVPSNEKFLLGETQVRSYINGLYTALPSLGKFGMGVRGEEKNSDNILSEIYDKRLNGEGTLFSSNEAWETGYKNLRNVNYFFHYYQVPAALETDEVKSLKGEAYFLRAYWHFVQLKKFGNIPIMDGFWDEQATIAGLQIPQKDRGEVAKFILGDLDTAQRLLFKRNKYSGLRICKEAAMLLAMQVALYEGSWEKYHKNDAFAAATDQSDYFFGEVIRWGDLLFQQGIELNTKETDKSVVSPGDAYGHLFNQKDYSNTPEVLFWKKYSVAEGVFHLLPSLLGGGVVDQDGPAGVSGDLVNTYLNADGTPIDPKDDQFKNFNRTFENRDLRLTETIMSTGYKFKSTAKGSRPMNVQDASTGAENIVSPFLVSDGNAKNVTGYHIRLGVDTTYVSGDCETGLVIMRYADALLCYAEAAAELKKCDGKVLEKTLIPLRKRANVEFVTPVLDPNFTDYGYTLTPLMQEIRRERRVELALQGYRLDDLMRWAGAKVIVGKRGRGAYLGEDGILYKSFDQKQQEALATVLVDGDGWMDPLQELLPGGYQFNPSRDYLLPIPPSELKLNRQMKQNPGWE